MNEQHRLAFHAETGIDDWRVLYCGPVAHFATDSVRAGTAFATEIAALDAVTRHPPLIDVRPDGVTVRLHADLLALDDAATPADAADRARAVSAVARAHGLPARPDRLQDVQVAIATQLTVDEVLPFWRAVLGYVDNSGEDLVDPHGRGPSIWFQGLDAAKPLRHVMHLDLAVPREVAAGRRDAAVAAGGRLASDVVAPRFWTYADAAGNKVDLVAWPDLPLTKADAEGWPGDIMFGRDATAAPASRSAPIVVAGAAELEHGETMFEAFRAASDLEDWPVVFWGPTAWFGTTSLARSAELAAALAEQHGADRLQLDLRADGLAVRFARDFTELVDDDLELARRFSAIARELGAVADPTQVQTVQVAIASKPDHEVRPFWRELFGYAEHGAEDLVDLGGRGPSLWFQELPAEKPLRHAFHIDVSLPRAVGRARVDAALAAGGRIAAQADGGAGEQDWWTLADPAGNKVDIAVWADRDG
ncbi:VOC family protein [Agromyces sp. Marseille-Q5079]|uniref:VOC family protein n=1 Tax=Agromyces sp. Marseille-Q5079 TaxID=3439059 RepID=UPI003D9CA678